jgi:hypothetical protein
MQGGDYRHPEISQQRQQMAAARASKNSELVLQAKNINVYEIQEIRRPPVCGDILLGNFETDFGRVIVSLGVISHGDYRALQVGVLGGDCFAQIRCESGNSTLPRNIIRQKCNLSNVAWQIHLEGTVCHKRQEGKRILHAKATIHLRSHFTN